MMKIDHIALYCSDLEAQKEFYQTYFHAACGELYHNPRTGFSSYFLSFEDGCRIELMHMPALEETAGDNPRIGLAHFAFNTGSKENVDHLTQELQKAGCPLQSGPRTTGDGYYESCLLDLEGNRIELTI